VTALSANTQLETRNEEGIQYGSATVKAGSTIYANALVVLDVSVNTAMAAHDDAGTTKFLGIALNYTQAGETVNYFYGCDVLLPFDTTQAFTAGNGLTPVYALDDGTVTQESAYGPFIGATRGGNFFETTSVWVGLSGGPTVGLAESLSGGTLALTDGATIATDASRANCFSVTTAGNRAFSNPTGLQTGVTYTWVITQDTTGGRQPTFGTTFKFQGGDPVFHTEASDVNVVSGVYDGTNIHCTVVAGSSN
jgi:hypothetical protein